MLDPVTASRLQFAFMTIVHIIFPAMGMGLVPFLIYFTWKSIRIDDPVYEQFRRSWTKIFAVSFVIDTVAGIVLELEFRTNFMAFSTAVGELFGGPLATEGVMVFTLEAMFLGVLILGREKVSDALYMVSAVAVGLGTWLSAVWTLVANSWMWTPQGYELARESGQPVVSLVDPITAYTNPRFPWMFVYIQNAAMLLAVLFMTGVAAYHVRWHGVSADDDREDARFWWKASKIALVALLMTALSQVIHGDAYGWHVYETQPQEFAAMEAVWETNSYVPEYIFAILTSPDGIIDPRAEKLFGIGIPGGASWLASGGDPQVKIIGLNEFDVEAPPVTIVFWSFRPMVAAGFWFTPLAFWAGYRWWVDGLYEGDLSHKAFVGSSPLGIFAVEVGRIATKVGRQPWVIQGVLRTSEGVSPGLANFEATLTLVGLVVVYTGLLAPYTYVIRRIIREGPLSVDETEADAEAATPVGVTGDD